MRQKFLYKRAQGIGDIDRSVFKKKDDEERTQRFNRRPYSGASSYITISTGTLTELRHLLKDISKTIKSNNISLPDSFFYMLENAFPSLIGKVMAGIISFSGLAIFSSMFIYVVVEMSKLTYKNLMNISTGIDGAKSFLTTWIIQHPKDDPSDFLKKAENFEKLSIDIKKYLYKLEMIIEDLDGLAGELVSVDNPDDEILKASDDFILSYNKLKEFLVPGDFNIMKLKDTLVKVKSNLERELNLRSKSGDYAFNAILKKAKDNIGKINFDLTEYFKKMPYISSVELSDDIKRQLKEELEGIVKSAIKAASHVNLVGIVDRYKRANTYYKKVGSLRMGWDVVGKTLKELVKFLKEVPTSVPKSVANNLSLYLGKAAPYFYVASLTWGSVVALTALVNIIKYIARKLTDSDKKVMAEYSKDLENIDEVLDYAEEVFTKIIDDHRRGEEGGGTPYEDSGIYY